MFLRSSVALIYTADFLAATLHLSMQQSYTYVDTQQHYAYLCISITLIYATALHTHMQQRYTYLCSSIIYAATYAHSSITYTTTLHLCTQHHIY